MKKRVTKKASMPIFKQSIDEMPIEIKNHVDKQMQKTFFRIAIGILIGVLFSNHDKSLSKQRKLETVTDCQTNTARYRTI